ncbi:MAG: TetR/AcrR family transcriptional regulator [Spirochaetes bacterium]|nr:MAG: TetR/AcrR family transcriptional regulator [Spirochaetota bacterium]
MTSKSKILNAAIEVFAEKGKHGATMDEIGGRAGINKAMVYYYYTSKDMLYHEALMDIIKEQSGRFATDPRSEQNPGGQIATIERLIRKFFYGFNQDQNKSKILFESLINYPNDLHKVIKKVTAESEGPEFFAEEFLGVLKKGIKNKTFRNINPEHTLISILGMSIIYNLMGKSIAETFLSMPVGDEKAFISKREKSITDLVLYGICTQDAGGKGQ